jgi:ribose transport system permease protein
VVRNTVSSVPSPRQPVSSASPATEPQAEPRQAGTRSVVRRRPASAAIALATIALFLISLVLQPQSLSSSSLQGMLPFAAILAIVAIGQTLVVQQGGIDLSVPGMVSLAVVIATNVPKGDDGKLLFAVVLAFGATMAAGTVSGLLVSRVGITSIVTTLGINALLIGTVLQVSNGNATRTTNALHDAVNTDVLSVPITVFIAAIACAAVGVFVKRTVAGRRFEAVGAGIRGARAAGLRPTRHLVGAYVGAAALYCLAGLLLAGVVRTPSAQQGDTYLLPSVAAVVLGGTSLLGGRGSVVASAIAALFLSQLDQVVLTSGVNSAVQNLVQAAALAVGIAVYSVPWGRVREALSARRAVGRDGARSGPPAPA